MLNHKHLYYFWCVARTGSITRAAERLHLTPQTLSGQITKLERTLGTPLFQRSGRRMDLTQTGELALPHVEEIFNLGQELEALLRDENKSNELSFRVGLADVVPKSIAHQLLLPATQLDEPVRLMCYDDKLDRLFAQLAIHELDLVICDRPLPRGLGVKGFSHSLGSSNTAFFATPQLAAQYRENFPHSLDGAPLLLPSRGTAIHGPLGRWLEEQRVVPRVVGEFDDSALMKAFGRAGAGLFPAPEVIAEEARRQLDVEVIGIAHGVEASYYAVSLERKLRHPAVVAVSEAAREKLFLDRKQSS